MGNIESASPRKCDSPVVTLAILAVARDIHLERSQLLDLYSVVNSKKHISRTDLKRAMVRVDVVDPTTTTLIDLLFTMWDQDGIDIVPTQAFCVGMAPLACPENEHDVASILRFALHVIGSDGENNGHDDNDDNDDEVSKKGTTGRQDLQVLLEAINTTASYFGDAHLKQREILKVLNSVFDDEGRSTMEHEECIQRLVASSYIRRFVKGKTQLRVQFKEELEEVLEFHVPETPSLFDDTLSENAIISDLAKCDDMKGRKLRQEAAISLLDDDASLDSKSDDNENCDGEKRSPDPPAFVQQQLQRPPMKRLPIQISHFTGIRLRSTRDPPTS